MKFLKKNVKLIVGIVLGIILVSGISVYATYTYFAKDVSYTKSDGTKISVESALNELYTNNNMKIELLWTNEYPNSSFSSQKISLDLSSYMGVFIDATYGYNGLTSTDCLKQKIYIPIGATSIINGTQVEKYASTAREASVSTTGITFSVGRMYDKSNQASNNYAVPLHIWGVK